MLLAESDQVLFAHQGFPAGIDVHVHAHVLALADDVIDFLKAQVQLVAVLGGPAACAVQVTGGGGVQQDCPGNVAVIFIPQLLLAVPAYQVGIDEEVDRHRGEHLRVHILDHVADKGIIGVIGVLDGGTDGFPLPGEFSFGKPVCPVHHFSQILLRILV